MGERERATAALSPSVRLRARDRCDMDSCVAALRRGQPYVHTGSEAALVAVRASGVKLCALGRDGLALTEAGYDCAVRPKEPSTQVRARVCPVRARCERR